MSLAELLWLWMQLLLQFGLGHQLPGGKFDWSHIHRHMATVSLPHINKYAELVMAQLSEPANDRPFFADGILKKDILQLHGLNQVSCALTFVAAADTAVQHAPLSDRS